MWFHRPFKADNWTLFVRLFTYDERDVTLYALGIGACGTNALDDKELKYVYHENGQKFIKVLLTFAAIYSLGSINISEIPRILFDPRLLLHGQQFIEIYRPLPTCCIIRNKTSIVGLHDKGKAVILELEVLSYGESSDEPVCMNRLTLYLWGAGGFSKSPHPYSYTNYQANRNVAFKHPKRQPFAVYEECTQPSQAVNYLKIRSLMDLTCRTLSSKIKVKTPEEIGEAVKNWKCSKRE
ncbi:enoyl-CoA hydratase 2, peroxisomal-like [Apium graveolens]|uniref:enoyl-CoA hydratase 2, peroxisomal-like n=2 Tax=Apium graveolens TaxID=4045 RepID=UPI003D78B3B3